MLHHAVSTLKHLKLSISDEHITVVEAKCNWAGAKTYVGPMVDEEKTSPKLMLTKPFSVMNPEDWDRNTNGVERAMQLFSQKWWT